MVGTANVGLTGVVVVDLVGVEVVAAEFLEGVDVVAGIAVVTFVGVDAVVEVAGVEVPTDDAATPVPALPNTDPSVPVA